MAGCTGGDSGTAGLSESALEQLRLLGQEKRSRTPEQQKMSSALLLAAKRLRNDPLLLALPDLKSNLALAGGGNVLVDIKATVDPPLLERIIALGGRITASVPRFDAVQAEMPVNSLEALAAVSQVRSIREALGFTTWKDNTSQGDVAHSAGITRALRGITGSGVTIGVISNGVDTMPARQLTDDLPRWPQLQVLSGQAGSGDEGTAMLEVVYDLAPGANLLFATANPSAAQMAQNILDLRAAGANIIVDDTGYWIEGAFQDDVIAQAVNIVTSAGALYFSAAGNNGNKNDGTAGTYEGDYLPDPTTTISGYPDVHHFGGGTWYDRITLDGPSDYTKMVSLQWSDPLEGSSNDYDLFLVNSSLTSIYAASTGTQNGTQNPVEAILAGTYEQDATGMVLVIARNSGAAQRRVRLVAHPRGRLAVTTNGAIWGHAAAENAFAVGAVNVTSGAFVGGASNPIEPTSADGPRQIFYTADGTPITPGNFLSSGGTLRAKPDTVAANRVATATPGFNPFTGTSAAASHAAAIAALLLEWRPDIATVGDAMATYMVRNLINMSSLDIEASGFDENSGAGIMMADTIISVCGDGVVGGLEHCDEGPANGTSGSCCSANCKFWSTDVVCRSQVGTCDVPEMCTGTSGVCPADSLMPSGTVCRVTAGACDVAETCTGSSGLCPANSLQPSGTICRVASGPCDAQETCSGSSADCPDDSPKPYGVICRQGGDCDEVEVCTGSSVDCPPDILHPAGTVCRFSTGPCDLAETCTGSDKGCPADSVKPAGTVCRVLGGACDVAETCSGSTKDCPEDSLVPAGTVCRAVGGPCDVEETCTGSEKACPVHMVKPAGTLCRAAAGDCDVAEACTGNGVACPADGFQASGTECRVVAGPCDVAETCTGSAAACPADSFQASGTECRAAAGACDVAETCSGSRAACPVDRLQALGAECRAVAGPCDVAETCTGSRADCPVDRLQAPGTECRAAAGPCDEAETCTGLAAACPANSLRALGTICRWAAGLCDEAETCTGLAAACPTDRLRSKGTECRAAAGDCDVAEACAGDSADCPVDRLKTTGTECRAAAGECDVAEACAGDRADCPVDRLLPSGMECRAAAGICDVAEACAGNRADCPVDHLAASGTVCRAAAGECDVAETCTGTAAMCPADVTSCGIDAGIDSGIDGPTCQCSGTGPDGPVTAPCGGSACGSDNMVYACSASGWTWTGEACAESCECTGTGTDGPVTVSCGQSACGADHIVYSCGAGGWTWTGQACSGNTDGGPCQCSGTGPGGASLTVNCSETACGADFRYYTCTAGGWTGPGDACVCNCSGTGPGGVPVTVNCGESACGSDYTVYACGGAGWSWTGQSCADAGTPGCECTGTGVGGEPVTVNCGESACGSDHVLYACGEAGWSWTGQVCGACQCTGTGPGGVPVTVDCGQSACGSDYNLYTCDNRSWSWTGQGCTAPRVVVP